MRLDGANRGNRERIRVISRPLAFHGAADHVAQGGTSCFADCSSASLLLLPVLIATSQAAEPLPPPARWIPRDAIFTVEVLQPKAILDLAFDGRLTRLVSSLPGYQAMLNQEGPQGLLETRGIPGNAIQQRSQDIVDETRRRRDHLRGRLPGAKPC